MPWLISIGFKALGFGKAALAWLMRNPLVLVCCILAATTFVYRGNALHCHQTVKARDATIAAMLEARALAEAKSKQEADHAETFHTAVAAAGPNLVAAYAGPRRVRPAPASPPATQGDGAAVPEVAPAVSTVAVPESVLNTCDADYSYALSAHEWAKQFEATQ